jgi:hypothetical protein
MNRFKKYLLKKLFSPVFEIDDIKINYKNKDIVIDAEDIKINSKGNYDNKIKINGKEFSWFTNLIIEIDGENGTKITGKILCSPKRIK